MASREQLSIVVVRPGMVRTDEFFRGAAVRATNARTTVATNVVKASHLVVVTARDDQGLASDLIEKKVAGFANAIDVSHE